MSDARVALPPPPKRPTRRTSVTAYVKAEGRLQTYQAEVRQSPQIDSDALSAPGRPVKGQKGSRARVATTEATELASGENAPLIHFFAPCLPIAQPRQRHRGFVAGGRVITTNYTPAKHPVNAFKALVALASRQVWSKDPLQGPLKVEVTFRFPLPASARVGVKRRVAGGEWVPHSHKPDLENCVKSLQDGLTGICWVDDSQVAEGIWRKGYGVTPGVEVSVWGLGNEE